jgi:hypothetical protein
MQCILSCILQDAILPENRPLKDAMSVNYPTPLHDFPVSMPSPISGSRVRELQISMSASREQYVPSTKATADEPRKASNKAKKLEPPKISSISIGASLDLTV